MKLDNKHIWLTGEKYDNGIMLKQLEFKTDNNHTKSIVYYKSGIEYIDNHFSPKDYISKGYNCTLVSTVNGFSIAFLRFVSGNLVDLAYAHIDRSYIEFFEENAANNLKVEKDEEVKHIIKNIVRKGSAAGIIISSITDNIVNINTHCVDGVEYKLYYRNKLNFIDFVTLYTSNEFKNEIELFLNTYYKKTLPEQAKTPVIEAETKCFIATACYRDVFSEEVIFFREYRDNKLKKSIFGKLFVTIYYKISPYFYNILFDNPKLSRMAKYFLDKLYINLK